jgi:hypothetical protein
VSGGIRFLTGADPRTLQLQSAVHTFITNAGVNLDTNIPANLGKAVFWNDRRGTLTVRATEADLARIETALAAHIGAPRQIDLKVTMVALPMAKTNSDDDWKPLSSGTAGFQGILTKPQFTTAIAALAQRSGAQVLTAPETITEVDRTAAIQLQDAKSATPSLAGSPALDILPKLGDDKTSITITTILAVKQAVEDPGGAFAASLDHYQLVESVKSVTVPDGQTAVLEQDVRVKGDLTTAFENRHLLVFVTPTILNPDGTRYYSQEQLDSANGQGK